jgi:hypothetical protein
MSKPHIELIQPGEFESQYDDRLRTDEINDDTFYTFMGRVQGLAAKAVKAVVKFEHTDIIPNSSTMRAYSRMHIMDADLRPSAYFDSHIVHGLWTPQSRNRLIIQRSIFRSEVKLGYVVPNESFIDPDMLDAWANESTTTQTSDLPDPINV